MDDTLQKEFQIKQLNYSNKEIEQYLKNEQIRNSKNFTRSSKSSYSDEYKQWSQKFIKQKLQIRKILQSIKNNQIGINFQIDNQFNQNPIFEHIDIKQNIIHITLKIHRFRQKFTVLIQDKQSPFHKDNNFKCGCFGTVYQIPTSQNSQNSTKQKQSFIIKCIKLNMKKPQVFQFYLMEYFFINLFSQLGIGPKSNKAYGFDFIIWNDCIQYTMEKCVQIHQKIKSPQQIQKLFEILQNKLFIIHKLNIIHFDIKPQNIMYSNSQRNLIFIDYGCTKFIKQKPGQLSKTQFVGTYEYASQQMKKTFFGQNKSIDLYYNDLCCLKKSQEKLLLDYQISLGNSFVSQHSYLDSSMSYSSQIQNNKVLIILQINIVLSKFYLQNNDYSQLNKQLSILIDYQSAMMDIILYLLKIKPSISIKKCYEQIISSYIVKFKFMYLNSKSNYSNKKINVNIKKDLIKSNFTNILEIIDYLETVYIKNIQPFKGLLFKQQNQFSQNKIYRFLKNFQQKCNKRYAFQISSNKSIYSNRNQRTTSSFGQFFHSLHTQQKNIHQLRSILLSKQIVQSFPKQEYFSIYLYCINFTKNLGIQLNQKIQYAVIFCQVYCNQIEKLNNQFSLSSKNQYFKKYQFQTPSKKRSYYRNNHSLNNSPNKKTPKKHLQVKIQEQQFIYLSKSLQFLINYCITDQLTQCKILLFSTIITQKMLVYSINILDISQQKLSKLKNYITKWLQIISKDKKFSLLSKHIQVSKLIQIQQLMELTDFYIFNFDLINKKSLIDYLNQTRNIYQNHSNLNKQFDSKENNKAYSLKSQEYNDNKSQQINKKIQSKQKIEGNINKNKIREFTEGDQQQAACRYYSWFIRNHNVIDISQDKFLQIKNKLQKQFKIHTFLKKYFLKLIQIKVLSLEIVKGQSKTLENIQFFQQSLQNLHKELLKNKKIIVNFQYKLFLIKNKILKLSVTKFQYQKAHKILNSIQSLISCRQITNKMFLLQKCYLMRPQAFNRLMDILSKLIKNQFNCKLNISNINIDFLYQIISMKKYAIYNQDTNLGHYNLQKNQYRELQWKLLYIVKIKQNLITFQYRMNIKQIKKFKLVQRIQNDKIDNKKIKNRKSNYVIYFWLQTLDTFFHTCTYYKSQIFQLYQQYFNLTLFQNRLFLSKLRFKFTFLINKKIAVIAAINKKKSIITKDQYKDQTDLISLIQKFQRQIILQIQKVLFQKQTSFCFSNQNQVKECQKLGLEQTTQRSIIGFFQYSNSQPLMNYYFKTAIYIIEICNLLGKKDKIQQITMKLLQFASKNDHYLSFYEGYNLIYQLLMTISRKIVENQMKIKQIIKTQYIVDKCLTGNRQKQQIISDQKQILEQKLWHFILRISTTLRKIPQNDIQLSYLIQIQTYSLSLKQIIFKGLVKQQRKIDQSSLFEATKNDKQQIQQKLPQLIQYYIRKFQSLTRIQLQKNNGLLLFLINIIQIKVQFQLKFKSNTNHKISQIQKQQSTYSLKIYEKNSIQVSKLIKTLLKITQCLDFIKPFFKSFILGKYYKIFSSIMSIKKFCYLAFVAYSDFFISVNIYQRQNSQLDQEIEAFFYYKYFDFDQNRIKYYQKDSAFLNSFYQKVSNKNKNNKNCYLKRHKYFFISAYLNKIKKYIKTLQFSKI